MRSSAASLLVARLSALAAALLFSTGGTAVKSCDLTSWQVACFRSGVAALALLIFLPSARRRPGRAGLAVGVAYAATLIFFVVATKSTTAAHAIFLQSTAPLYVLLLAPWLLGERIRGRDLVFMAVMIGALVLVLVGAVEPTTTAPRPVLGNTLATLAGITWALAVVGLRFMGRDPSAADERPARARPAGRGAITAVTVGNVLAFLFVLPVALPVESSDAADWGWIGYLGVVQIALAYVLLVRAVRDLEALEVSLLLLVEPVFNPVWTFLVHGETPGALAVVGGVTILGATAVKSWFDARRPRLAVPSGGVA